MTDILGLDKIKDDFTDMLGFGQNDQKEKKNKDEQLKLLQIEIIKNEIILKHILEKEKDIKEREVNIKNDIERHTILKNELIELMNKIDKKFIESKNNQINEPKNNLFENKELIKRKDVVNEKIKQCEYIFTKGKTKDLQCEMTTIEKFCGKHNKQKEIKNESLYDQKEIKKLLIDQKEIKKLCKGITKNGNPCKNKEKKNGFCVKHSDITLNINDFTVKELKTYAKHIKLTNYSDKKRDELIKMINYQLKR